jgi:GNAT superfamily N-acetyltransferase
MGLDSVTTLPDGSTVELTAMHHDDGDRLVRFHSRLSPQTTHRRFFSIHPELSPEEVHRFTHVDHVDREAIIAVVDGEILGVARFDRLKTGNDTDAAFVVDVAWQHRGLGTALFAHLVERARELGVTRFVAQTLPENRPMLTVFRHAGLPITELRRRDRRRHNRTHRHSTLGDLSPVNYEAATRNEHPRSTRP